MLVKLQQPFFMQAILASVPEPSISGVMDNFDVFLRNKLIADFLHATLFTPATIMLTAMVALLFLLARGHIASWTRLVAICSFAALTDLLREVFQFVLLTLRGLGAVQSPRDLVRPVGLGLLFQHGNYVTSQIADAVNIFDIWFVTILVVAFERSEQIRRRDAVIAALGTWLMVQLFRCGTIYLLAEAV